MEKKTFTFNYIFHEEVLKEVRNLQPQKKKKKKKKKKNTHTQQNDIPTKILK